MAHNLATTNGKTVMMYTGEVPWHRLGTKLKEPATAREAIAECVNAFETNLRQVHSFFQVGGVTPT